MLRSLPDEDACAPRTDPRFHLFGSQRPWAFLPATGDGTRQCCRQAVGTTASAMGFVKQTISGSDLFMRRLSLRRALLSGLWFFGWGFLVERFLFFLPREDGFLSRAICYPPALAHKRTPARLRIRVKRGTSTLNLQSELFSPRGGNEGAPFQSLSLTEATFLFATLAPLGAQKLSLERAHAHFSY
jgi:hypothetical protein